MLFADASENAGWITAGGVVLLGVLKWLLELTGALSTRREAARDKATLALEKIVKLLQDDIDGMTTEINELKDENRRCGRRTAVLEREIIRLGGNLDTIPDEASGPHRAIALEGLDL